MKKSSKARLTLHRETLRNLASPELTAAGGGASLVNDTVGCPVLVSGRYSCGGTCDYLQCHNTDTSNRC
jgi:hypothetical protein